MKNKKIIITLSIIAILVLTIGITYSIFTSSKTGKNSNLVVGDIYMHYNETNQIQMENAMPTNPYVVNPIMATQEYTKGGTNELSKCVDAFVDLSASSELATTICKGGSVDNYLTLQQMYEEGNLDEANLTDTFMQENIIISNPSIPYFEFTVDGKNTTTNKDIWYEVVLSKGDNIDGKTRIKDNLLKFRLTETKDNKETIIVANKSYSDLTSKRIWVDTINKNTINGVVHAYRLYMWISNDTVIGNVNQDYTMEEWKSIFASIKVNVSGDFNEKYLPVEVETSCFTTQKNETGLTITDYDSSCGSNIIIPEEVNGKKITKIAPNAFNNKGLIYVDIPSSIVKIGAYAFTGNNITSINVPETVTNLHCKAFDDGVVKNRDMTCQETDESCFTAGTTKTYKVNNNMTTEELNKCTTHITNLNWDDGETPEAFCKGTGTNWGDTFQFELDDKSFSNEDLSYFENNNIITSTLGVAIIDYDKTCGTDVIIPSKIKGYPVTVIGNSDTIIVKQLSNKNNNYSFNNLNNYVNKKYKINKIDALWRAAFRNKNLTSVIIPDSVTTIERSAFSDNQLTSVVIPDSVTTIGRSAFSNNQLTNIEIPSSVTTIKEVAFYNNQLTSVEFSNPSKLERINFEAFQKNNISTVTIPETVTHLSCDAFDKNVLITKSDSLVCFQTLL